MYRLCLSLCDCLFFEAFPGDGAVGPSPWTPSLELAGLDWRSSANPNLAQSLGRGRGGEPFTKGSPHKLSPLSYPNISLRGICLDKRFWDTIKIEKLGQC